MVRFDLILGICDLCILGWESVSKKEGVSSIGLMETEIFKHPDSLAVQNLQPTLQPILARLFLGILGKTSLLRFSYFLSNQSKSRCLYKP